jgi:hypothetical protein
MGKVGFMDSGEARIRELGYKQELVRNFTLISNASIGFTAISILTGITGQAPGFALKHAFQCLDEMG